MGWWFLYFWYILWISFHGIITNKLKMKWFDEAFNEEIHTAFHQVVGAEHDVTWETWRFETKVFPAKTVSGFFQKTCQIDSNCQFDFCFLVILQCSSRSFEDANLWDGSMLLIITFQPWNQGKVKQLRHSCTHSLRWWIGRAIVQQWCRGSKIWNRKVVSLLPRLGVQFLGIMRCFGWSKDVINWSLRVSWCTDGDWSVVPNWNAWLTGLLYYMLYHISICSCITCIYVYSFAFTFCKNPYDLKSCDARLGFWRRSTSFRNLSERHGHWWYVVEQMMHLQARNYMLSFVTVFNRYCSWRVTFWYTYFSCNLLKFWISEVWYVV